VDEVLRRAEERTSRAFEVIEELDLLGRWSHCGRPVLVGSVTCGLVVNRDIDLNIYCAEPEITRGFEVISDIAAVPGVLKIRYSNCLGSIDQGLYWQIHYRDRVGDTWRVDNWLVSEEHPHAGLPEALTARMQNALTTEQRKSILQIKETVQAELQARGIDIYQAVIGDGVRSPREFAVWMQDRKHCEISQWLPPEQSQLHRQAANLTKADH